MSSRLATAPCLLRELLGYTPQTHAFVSDLDGRCDHAYTTSTARSRLPELDQRPTSSTAWTLQATCVKCRCHLHFNMDFSYSQRPCPIQDYPLHYFEFAPNPQLGERVHAFNFTCGAPFCKAKLDMELRAPVLTAQDIAFLTDSAALQQRASEATQQRQAEVPPSSALEALSVLRSYARDAVQTEQEKRIPVGNKRFMLALGYKARPLLERLGFVHEPIQEGANWATWRLPNVKTSDAAGQRTMLQDLEDELVTLIQRRPDVEKASTKEAIPDFVLSIHDMERILGCLDYPKVITHAHELSPPTSVVEAYRGLGAEPDFADSLLSFAYDQNVRHYPRRAPVFFQLLLNIAAFRGTEFLQTKVATLQSAGQVSQEDVVAAYQYFDIHPDRGTSYTDEQILGKYQSVFSDISDNEQSKAKEALLTIARARGSKFLQNTAADRFETYEEALAYLGADKSTPDDFILSLVTAKSGEHPSNQGIAQKALMVIADARKSDGLRYQGQRDLAKSTMTLAYAYSILGLSESDNVDDDTISAYHGVCQTENPGRAGDYSEAVSVIADARNSARLRQYLGDIQDHLAASDTVKKKGPMDPRGLHNIGNTCYLNSLLQYLYTIKPLRELLQAFEQHRQSLDDEERFVKKVAGMQASKADVKMAQEFVGELRKLFDVLATIDESSATPEVNLARLTIGEPKSSDPKSPAPTTNRRLTVSNVQSATAFPLFKSIPQEASTADATDATEGKTDTDREDPEDLKSHEPMDILPDKPKEEPDRFQVASEVPQRSEVAVEDNGEVRHSVEDADPAASVQTTESLKRQTEAWANQQDVTDALENVIKQLQWAIKPERLSNSGDQVDLISRLFWGTEHVIHVKPEGETPEVLDFKDLLVRPDEDPSDIKEALDDTEFGKEDHGPNFYKYSVVTNLPPILHIAVSRAKAENGNYVRNTNQLVLHQEIFMDRFMNDEEMVAQRKDAFKFKDTLRQLRASCKALEDTTLGLSASRALESSSAHTKRLNMQATDVGLEFASDDRSLQEGLTEEAKAATSRIKAVKATMTPLEEKLANLYSSTGKQKYCLQAVFVHVGATLISGHWFILIYDHRTDIWRKYNDEIVTVIDPKEVQAMVFEPDEAVRGASAYVSYVREDMRDEVFDVVAREPVVVESKEEDLIQLDAADGESMDDSGASAAAPGLRPLQPRPSWDARPNNDHLVDW